MEQSVLICQENSSVGVEIYVGEILCQEQKE